MAEEAYPSLRIVPSALAETLGDLPFVAIVRNREEFSRWLDNPLPGLRWLQVEGMLGDTEAWTEAAHQYSGPSMAHLLVEGMYGARSGSVSTDCNKKGPAEWLNPLRGNEPVLIPRYAKMSR